VVHSFFPDWASGIKYETSKELQDHVNGVSEHRFSGVPIGDLRGLVDPQTHRRR
jgi:hypothetical protein